MLSVSQPIVNAFRLQRSHLIDSTSAVSPARIASALCGAQAQVLSSGMLSLGIRSSSTEKNIAQAQARHGSLVKTWAMRGTLHLVASKDLSIFTSALGARAWEGRIGWMMQDGLKRSDAERMLALLADTVCAEPMTRKELSAIAAESLGDWVKPWIESGWGGAMNTLCRVGVAVFGPPKGAHTTFVRRNAWVRTWKTYGDYIRE